MSAAPLSDNGGPVNSPNPVHAAAPHLPVSVPVAPHSSGGPTPRTRKPRASSATTAAGREERGLRRADALVAQGQVDKAIAHLRRLVHAVPDSTRGHLRIATLLHEKKQSTEALAILRSVIQRAPGATAPREALAEICLEVGRWDEAIQQSRALLELTPRSLSARDVLSAAYLQRGLLDEALRIIDQMIRLDPMDAAGYFKRGVLLQQKGRVGAAVQAFQRVLQMDPESEAADESRAALEMLDGYQMRQIITVAVEDIPFRLYLRQNPAEAVASKGFLLSDAGLASLGQVRFDDLPDPPPGWRQYHYH